MIRIVPNSDPRRRSCTFCARRTLKWQDIYIITVDGVEAGFTPCTICLRQIHDELEHRHAAKPRPAYEFAKPGRPRKEKSA